MDDKMGIAIFFLVLVLAGLFLAMAYCGTPQMVGRSSGEVALSCVFPSPLSAIFGQRPVFVVNLFVVAGLPLVIFMVVWFWGMLTRSQ